jgi:hypothetical protein
VPGYAAPLRRCWVPSALLAYWLYAGRDPRGRWLLAGSFAASLTLLLLPGLLAFGPGYLVTYGADGQGRAFATFRQHFAALVAPLQWTPGPPPWDHPDPYVQQVFPGAASLGDVLRTPGLPYLDFVALSLSRGVRKLGWIFQWGWLAVPVLAWARRRGDVALDERERALLLSFVGCVPFVLLSYPHIRYFARYYPIFWLLVLVSLQRVARLEAAAPRRGAMAAAVAVLLALAWNAQRAAVGLAAAPHLPLYWFSD